MKRTPFLIAGGWKNIYINKKDKPLFENLFKTSHITLDSDKIKNKNIANLFSYIISCKNRVYTVNNINNTIDYYIISEEDEETVDTFFNIIDNSFSEQPIKLGKFNNNKFLNLLYHA